MCLSSSEGVHQLSPFAEAQRIVLMDSDMTIRKNLDDLFRRDGHDICVRLQPKEEGPLSMRLVI